ncbi:MAG: 6-phosphofructokinase [Bdellovibrionaceae bacterium]|nr:6-phosphofructokinase [Pseudobdellovibrionaceae bacterium]
MPQFPADKIKTIGIYTSGGDAPGMNAAIRAATRVALFHGLEVRGIVGGYPGMLSNEFMPLTQGSMGNILQRGGTILKTGRLPEFHQADVRAKAVANMRAAGIDALVCIGGDGSFTGAHLLFQEHKFPIVGLPGTIDNDIFGTDFTIGFDTAVNVALEAIDRIRDTAASHDRLFIVEVMGRDSGFIAVDVGVAGGAEEIFFPENSVTVDEAIDHIKRGMARGKKSSILIAAEGRKPGRAYDLAEAIRKKSGFDAKVCILGHIQRGGSPTAADRILASRLGAAAIETLRKGQCDCMVGVSGGQLTTVPFAQALGKKKAVGRELIELARVLSY